MLLRRSDTFRCPLELLCRSAAFSLVPTMYYLCWLNIATHADRGSGVLKRK